MWRMLQQPEPDDYVLATGETHSVREFVERAFSEVGIPLSWQGSDSEEQGIDTSSGRTVVEVDPRFFRPTEVDLLCGDAAKARAKLGWAPKETFDSLVKEMVRHDVALLKPR
jgi:GDPmannose 4,6-dehydratase